MIPHWLWVFMGLSGTGPFYAFWSAIAGSFVPTIMIAGMAYWWHHNCHKETCLRVGRRQLTIDGVHYRTCKKHHDVKHFVTQES